MSARPGLVALFARLFAAVLVALTALPAGARTITAEEDAALRARLAAYEAAWAARDIAYVVDAMPPRLYQAFIALGIQEGRTPAASRDAFIRGFGRAVTDAAALGLRPSIAYDLQSHSYRDLPDGTPFALISGTLTWLREGRGVGASVPGGRVFILAILDGGVWYFASPEQPSYGFLQQFYPSFAGVSFLLDRDL